MLLILSADQLIAPCLAYFANYSQLCTDGRFETPGTDIGTCSTLLTNHCTCCGAKCTAGSVTYGRILSCSYSDVTCQIQSDLAGDSGTGVTSSAGGAGIEEATDQQAVSGTDNASVLQGRRTEIDRDSGASNDSAAADAAAAGSGASSVARSG